MTSYRSAGSLLSRNRAQARQPPFGSVFSLSIRALSEYPRSVPEPLSWTILSPFERNATAKQGYERRPPIAYNLPLGACTLTHAFANGPALTQSTSLKHGCLSLARDRAFGRWPTPQRNAEKIPSSGAFNHVPRFIRGSLLFLHRPSDTGRGAAACSAAIIGRRLDHHARRSPVLLGRSEGRPLDHTTRAAGDF
jgi:hypothetical protein